MAGLSWQNFSLGTQGVRTPTPAQYGTPYQYAQQNVGIGYQRPMANMYANQFAGQMANGLNSAQAVGYRNLLNVPRSGQMSLLGAAKANVPVAAPAPVQQAPAAPQQEYSVVG